MCKCCVCECWVECCYHCIDCCIDHAECVNFNGSCDKASQSESALAVLVDILPALINDALINSPDEDYESQWWSHADLRVPFLLLIVYRLTTELIVLLFLFWMLHSPHAPFDLVSLTRVIDSLFIITCFYILCLTFFIGLFFVLSPLFGLLPHEGWILCHGLPLGYSVALLPLYFSFSSIAFTYFFFLPQLAFVLALWPSNFLFYTALTT